MFLNYSIIDYYYSHLYYLIFSFCLCCLMKILSSMKASELKIYESMGIVGSLFLATWSLRETYDYRDYLLKQLFSCLMTFFLLELKLAQTKEQDLYRYYLVDCSKYSQLDLVTLLVFSMKTCF